MQIHLLIFQTFIAKCFSCLPLDYYLSTYYGGLYFVLDYLCKRYFWGLIKIFIGCNPNFEQKWTFNTSPKAFGPYSKPKVEFRSWLPKYHIGNEKKKPQHLFFSWLSSTAFVFVFFFFFSILNFSSSALVLAMHKSPKVLLFRCHIFLFCLIAPIFYFCFSFFKRLWLQLRETSKQASLIQ